MPVTTFSATTCRDSHPAHRATKKRGAPTYLYQKGNIYYFRYVLSKSERTLFPLREIRLSLRTGFLNPAKKMARQLRAITEGFFMRYDAQEDYQAAKARLINKLETFINSIEAKTPPSIEEIKKRMDIVRQKMLDDLDATLTSPPHGILFKDGKPVQVSPEEYLEHTYTIFQKPTINSPKQLLAAHYPGIIIEFLKAEIFKPEELTPTSIVQILNEYGKVQLSLNRILLAREQGDYAYERKFTVPITTVQPDQTLGNTSEKESSLLLSELISIYIKTKLSDGQWKKHSVSDHRNRLAYLTEILGNRNINDITRTDFRKFRDILRQLPPNRKKSVKYRNKSIQEILAMIPEETLNIKTVNDIVQAVSSMFNWAEREGIIKNNYAKDLTLPDHRQDIEKREHFTAEDITKIFFSGDYLPENFISPAYYWIPLIGLYTGMRLEEISQLNCDDIKKENDIWFINISEEDVDNSGTQKILKNSTARRAVPIHQDILDRGFISFVEKVKEDKHIRLFHTLNKTKDSKYGKQPGKHFSKWIKEHGIQGKKSFHSLRHTFSHYFKTRNMHNDIFRQVFGHMIKELAGRQYGGKFSVQQCYNELVSCIDWSKYERGE